MEITLERMSLEELRELAENTLEKSVNAETVEEARKFDVELEEIVNIYTGLSKEECYNRCRRAENPLIAAILEFSFPSIREYKKEDKETHTISRSIVDCEKPIDIGDLHKKLGGVGADKTWLNMAEKFNLYLTLRAAKRLSDVGVRGKSGVKVYDELINNTADIYNMRKASREVALGVNDLSDDNILEMLDVIVRAMLGEEHTPEMRDVYYLIDVYSQDSRKTKTGVTAANHRTLRNYLKKVCYRVLTHANGYEVESREVK